MRGNTNALIFSTAILWAAACDPADAQLETSQTPADVEDSEPSFRGLWEPARCEITSNGKCPKFPGVVFPLNDTVNQAATDYGQCLARAKDYAAWCGTKPGKWVKATSYNAENEALVSKAWILNGCMIDIEQCPNHPELNFASVPDPAGTKDACLARARDFAVSCSPAQSANRVWAAFYVNGVVTAGGSASNLCLNKSCKGKDSRISPQSFCFSNTTTVYSRYISLYDNNGLRGASLALEGSGHCDSYVRAWASAWNGVAGRPTEVWIEREGQGAIPWTYASGLSKLSGSLYTVMAVAQGRMRACAKVVAGDGVGAVAGCTPWAPE